MWQRIQTVYLALVALANGVLAAWLPLFKENTDQWVMAFERLEVLVPVVLISLGALFCIFLYKKRQNQFVLNRLLMILNLFLLGFFVYRSLILSGETAVSEKGIGMLIPIFSIVFLVLANRSIKKDEDLVKSVDRLR
jgi:sugar phosphate permease